MCVKFRTHILETFSKLSYCEAEVEASTKNVWAKRTRFFQVDPGQNAEIRCFIFKVINIIINCVD